MRNRCATLSRWLSGVSLALALSALNPCVAQTGSEWEAAKKELASTSLANQADCQRVWEFLWLWAKRGQVEARVELWKLVGIGWLRPPGISQDSETIQRHVYTFLINGLPSDDPEVLGAVERMVTHRRMSQYSAQPYLDCVAASDRRACVERLVEMGLVADFDAYARELDMLAAAPGAKMAYCPPNAFHSPVRKE